jgi:hypothetical protein
VEIALTYVPNARQTEFHTAPEKYRLLLGAAGSGKSVALCVEDITLAFEYPGSTGVVMRHAYPQLRDTTKRTYLEMCPPQLIANEIKSEGREELEFVNGSRTLFRCLDDYRKLGSTAFDRISVDEAIEVEEREFMVLIARLRGKVGPRRLMLATNPPDEDHFLFDWFVTQATADKRVIHSNTYANAANLPEDYIRALEQYPAAWREKFLHGNWGFLADGKPVFGEYDPEKHVDTLHAVPGLPIIRGWDFGYRHPAVCFVQRTPTDHIHVLHELFGTDIELRTFAEQVVEESAKRFPRADFEDYCDIAGTQKNDRGPTSWQVLKDYGVYANGRKLGIFQSIERLRYLLREMVGGRPLLQVHTTCRWLQKALAGGYHIDSKTDSPAKDGTYDNVVDALRYAVIPITNGMTSGLVTPGTTKWPTNWRVAV